MAAQKDLSLVTIGITKRRRVHLCSLRFPSVFSSKHKYQSGSGWPSYYEVLNGGRVKKLKDRSLGMERIEIRCNNCDAHLGHLFNDGPQPTS